MRFQIKGGDAIVEGFVYGRPPTESEVADDQMVTVRNSYAKDIGIRQESGKTVRDSWRPGVANSLRWQQPSNTRQENE